MLIRIVGSDNGVSRRCPSCIVSMDCPEKTFYASMSFSYSYRGLKLYVFKLAIVRCFFCIGILIFRSLSPLCVYSHNENGSTYGLFDRDMYDLYALMLCSHWKPVAFLIYISRSWSLRSYDSRSVSALKAQNCSFFFLC